MKQYIVLELNPSTALYGKPAGLCGQTSSTCKIDFKRRGRALHIFWCLFVHSILQYLDKTLWLVGQWLLYKHDHTIFTRIDHNFTQFCFLLNLVHLMLHSQSLVFESSPVFGRRLNCNLPSIPLRGWFGLYKLCFN